MSKGAIPTFPGPKVAVPEGTYDLIYGLDVDGGAAIPLGTIPFEVPNMPPYQRERAEFVGDQLVPLGGPYHGRPFRVVSA